MWRVRTHDGVDAGELTEENHDVGVYDGAASSWLGEEIHPGVSVGASSCDLGFLFFCADFHDEELLACFVRSDAADSAPDLEGLEWLALVH
jgi:hypothetical protein